MNIIFFFSGCFLISLSMIGYGFFFKRAIFNKTDKLNLGYYGLIGIFFSMIYSYASNFIIPHSKINNLIFIIIGLSFFIWHLIQNDMKKELKFYLLIFFIFFISILILKNHDDFEYYHFPYTYLLTQYDLIIGIGNLGHGFRTQSSLFYLNSIFFLPYFKFNLFNLGAYLVVIYSNVIFLKYILKDFSSKKFKLNNRFINYISLMAFVFVNVFFYRLAEHGTDRSAQILIFLLFIETIYFFNLKTLSQNVLIKIYLLTGLIISLKAFYILYLIIFLPIFYHLVIKLDIFRAIKFFLLNKIIIYLIIFLMLIISINILNTGCFIYPVYFTCMENFTWAIPIEQVKSMNDWYEQWSKAGAGIGFRVENSEYYIESFNWVNNWIKDYFFTKVSDLIFGLFLLGIIFLLIFKNKKEKKNYEKINFLKVVYFILIILFLEWFYNHPALRYGGYTIIALLAFIPLSFYFSNISLNDHEFKKKATIIIMLTLFIFVSRNFIRLKDEYNVLSYNPLLNPYYNINKKHLRIDNKLKFFFNSKADCYNDPQIFCSEKFNIKTNNLGYYVISKRQNNAQ